MSVMSWICCGTVFLRRRRGRVCGSSGMSGRRIAGSGSRRGIRSGLTTTSGSGMSTDARLWSCGRTRSVLVGGGGTGRYDHEPEGPETVPATLARGARGVVAVASTA